MTIGAASTMAAIRMVTRVEIERIRIMANLKCKPEAKRDIVVRLD